MYHLYYYRDKDEDSVGYHSVTCGESYTGIGILYGMLCYLIDRSIRCFEVKNCSNDELVLSWSR